MTLEICAYSLESAIAAQAGGANRVELCSDPAQGGITPSYGSIVVARQELNVELHVIIRPRGGDFLYSPPEFEVMREDIQLCRRLGVDGVVLGILLPDARVDKERCRELAQLARPMSVTFHRAFDMTADAFAALEDVIEIGCHRILTSGHADSALQGASLIAELVERAGERVIVMAGAGISEENLAQLVETTGALEFHASARMQVSSKMLFRNSKVRLGAPSLISSRQVEGSCEFCDNSVTNLPRDVRYTARQSLSGPPPRLKKHLLTYPLGGVQSDR
ncbi:MAG: copper homeostasis protein CutC [Verrucomicrobia bacterium]|nr:MAG: copper homeostasis protein CutC [Verrucomicrobiota bacterium]